MSKCIICRCEDVTREEILKAIKEGFLDLETIKRYTGLGTGACQGKACIPLLSGILSNINNHLRSKNSKPFTARNPCFPLAFKYFNEK